jgi:hypothetical protein
MNRHAVRHDLAVASRHVIWRSRTANLQEGADLLRRPNSPRSPFECVGVGGARGVRRTFKIGLDDYSVSQIYSVAGQRTRGREDVGRSDAIDAVLVRHHAVVAHPDDQTAKNRRRSTRRNRTGRRPDTCRQGPAWSRSLFPTDACQILPYRHVRPPTALAAAHWPSVGTPSIAIPPGSSAWIIRGGVTAAVSPVGLR